MQDVNPAVSVIVPVYKAEKYLRKCVDSLLAQTFRDFEVLLVDDGSPDRSGVICDEYARQDRRVRVFHKANGGVSSARQCGLDNARGEYTIHADPDDWVEPNMLEELYRKAKDENADMVICDYYVNDNLGQCYMTQRPSALDHETVLRELFQQLHGSCCNKLVSRACYKACDVVFPQELTFCEDLYVNAALLKHVLRIAYDPHAYYHYDCSVNENSLVRAYSRYTYTHDVVMLRLFSDLLAGTEAYALCRASLCGLLVSRAFWGGAFTSREFRDKCRSYAREASYRESSLVCRTIRLSLSVPGSYCLIRRTVLFLVRWKSVLRKVFEWKS